MTSLRSSSTPSTTFSSPSRRDLLKLAGAGAGSTVGLSLLAACGSKSSTSSKATGSSSASAGTQTITDMAGKQVEVPTHPAPPRAPRR